MTLLTNPVAYWMDAAAAHREHAVRYAKTTEHARLHEEHAVECERKAAEAAAEHAFSE